MKKAFVNLFLVLFSTALFSQAGHIMQGIGAVNMSMGGAATAMPLDINGAMHWNPAALSVFDDNILSANAGLFMSSPELSSSIEHPMFGTVSGVTEDDRGNSIMPALAAVFGKQGSKHTFGASAFGVSGFGVTFPENTMNPINNPQNLGGFGHIESDYIMLQIGLSYAYEITDNFSLGIQPTINYATLQLAPNPLSSPNPMLGYPESDKASAIGYGAQIGVFFQADNGINLGASYKSPQFFSDFEFNNTYLDGSEAPEVAFNMDYPAIYSIGIGYSNDRLDLTMDYRMVDYENTAGFEASGWTPTASVAGFGWENISIISAGIQYKGFEKVPLRVGYTYSSTPINEELAFFSVPATAIIKNAFQVGIGYEMAERLTFNLMYHHGMSGDKTSGQLLNPMAIAEDNPLGKVPGSEVSYEMTTDLISLGIDFTF